jgi:hypothetical protein
MPFITCDLEEGLSDIEKQVLVTKMTEITHRCIGSQWSTSTLSCASIRPAISEKPDRPDAP